MSFLQEFKEFALKGNVVDMAVGVIIGTAFGKIVSSLVADIAMPPIGLITGGVKFTKLQWVLQPEHLDADGKAVAAVTMNYGVFLQNVIDFLLVALTIFLIIRLMHNLRLEKPKPEEQLAPPELTTQEKLLTEIRDLLQKTS